MTVPTPEALAELVTLALTKTQQQILAMLRSIANESRIAQAREALTDSLLNIEGCQRELRSAQQAERDAKTLLDEALTEAEWETRELRLVKEGTKTWWITEELDHGSYGDPVRRQVTAEEGRDLVAREARAQPSVVEAAKQLRMSEEMVAAAKDRLTLAERAFSACKADVYAASAQLTALATTLPLVINAGRTDG